MEVQFRLIFLIVNLIACWLRSVETKKSNSLHENRVLFDFKLPIFEVPTKSKVARKRSHDPTNEYVEENCSKNFKAELTKLREQIKCEPRDTVVELMSPLGSTVTPNAVLVKRCGGICYGAKKCVPVQRRNRKFYVRTVKYNRIHCSSIVVPEDLSCKCSCEKKSSDCNYLQNYDRNLCACECKNKDDYFQCSLNERMDWDEENCACVCRKHKTCTTGTRWNETLCRCMVT